MPIDIADYERRLLERRQELVELESSNRQARDTVELDQSRVGRLSRMDALQGQAMAEATYQRRKLELTRIESALKRIAEGDYGYCLVCGEEIAVKRLQSDPATPTCVDCAGSANRTPS